jgi:3D-(3,5/4)-trihydroxycyclohexane-1,2-dione acylhydrolase (decyclizing)
VTVVEVDPDVNVPIYESWWDVPIPAVSTSPTVREARAAYEQRQREQRWFG